jgi:hypothetical protein
VAVRLLALLVALVLLTQPQHASAAPPPDPPLTYELTVYDRDPARLAPDGTKVTALAQPPRSTSCGEAEVRGGVAELRVEVSELCPAGMTVFFVLTNLPGGAITAYADPLIQWRAAYSEETVTLRADVRPIPAPAVAGIEATPLVCPPNLPAIGAARTERFGNVAFDMPAGRYLWLESPPGSGRIVVCSQSYGAVSFSSETCAPLAFSVFPPIEEGEALRRVVSSCRIVS